MNPSVVIVGGGPAGCSAGRLLASWGHRVLLLNHPRAVGTSDQPRRGLAESLPPTTRKLLAEVGVLDAVERAGFYRSTGNTVWWGARDRRVEAFGHASAATGFQVHRPDFDRVLAREATLAGVEIRSARVRRVALDDDDARIEFDENGAIESVRCRFVLDCSGRAGVVARMFRRPGLRMYALVGEWHAASGWNVPDPTHTLVEAYDRGWAWSVPISPTIRHAGVMIDGPSPRGADAGASAKRLEDAYRSELGRAGELAHLLGASTLRRAWACDASTYASDVYAGRNFLLLGDAASFIDPLSSYGVKKALASAWVAAIAVNTCLTDADRQRCALDFFSAREREMSTSHARRAREFASAAAASYPHPFWTGRAAAAIENETVSHMFAPPDVNGALRRIRESEVLDLALGDGVRFEPRPVIRGREIVLEDALSLPPPAGSGGPGPTLRFVDNVDLVALAVLASRHRQVPDLVDAYCRTSGPAPLPRVLGGLSLLVAAGVLRQRTVAQC